MLPLSMATTIQEAGGAEGVEFIRPLPPIRTDSSSRRFDLSRRQAPVWIDTAAGSTAASEQEQESTDDDKQLEGGARSSAAGTDIQVEECVTPKSDHHVLKPLLVCPPAPRKPKPVKRKHISDNDHDENSPRRYFVVSVDLATVFIARPQPSKRRKTGQQTVPQLSYL